VLFLVNALAMAGAQVHYSEVVDAFEDEGCIALAKLGDYPNATELGRMDWGEMRPIVQALINSSRMDYNTDKYNNVTFPGDSNG